jgi:DNA repair protein RadC
MGFKDAGKPHYLGHRERLRKRFRDAGADALPDYELLELVLFRAVRAGTPSRSPRRQHLRRGHEYAGRPVFGVPDLGEAAVTEIKLVRAAALRLMRGEVVERPVLASWQQVLDYCHAAMGFAAKEQFRILFLDKRDQAIADEIQQQARGNQTCLGQSP